MERGWDIYHIYCDEDYSGADRLRPDFNRMIQAAKEKQFQIILCKSQSRFTRDMELVEKYIHGLFPIWGIRFIAIADNADTEVKGNKKARQINGLVNEWYLEDLSENIRMVFDMKRRQGRYIGGFPIYGYQKDPKDHNHLIIEPEAAQVVRQIFRWSLEGHGKQEIAKLLNDQGIPNPTRYKAEHGWASGHPVSNSHGLWNKTTIWRILRNEMYTGVMLQGRRKKVSYKSKALIDMPKEQWFRVEGTHEAIIDRQTWEKVQALQKGTRRKKPTVTQEPSVYSGLLKCPECGGNLNFHFNQNNHDIKFFSCQNHNSGYRKCSKTHYIRLDFLEQVVLYEVKRLACFASEYENDFIKAMIGRSAKVAEITAIRKQRELDALTARDRELDMLFERLYEDNVAGKIDDARFAKMSKRYEQEQGENAKKIKALRLELKKDESKRMDIDDFLETVRRYTDATTITKRMVAELIDHIEVYHAEKQDGVTNQRVVIYYNCIGAFDVPDRRKIPEADIIMETRKGVALSYAPEQVAV